MKKMLVLLVVMAIFALGFGTGQYFHEKGLAVPGLATAAVKPVAHVVTMPWSNRDGGIYQWGIFIDVDQEIARVEKTGPRQAVLWIK